MTRANDISADFERKPSALAGALDFVRHYLHGLDTGAATSYAVTLAVEELFTNAVKFSPECSHPIRLRLTVEGDSIVVCFKDKGSRPFDITRVAPVDPNRPIEEIKPGGLGLHLTRALMDSVEYEYTDMTNVITMIKRLE